MRSPEGLPHDSTVRRYSPLLLLLGTAVTLVILVVQPGADAAEGPTPGIGVIRWGTAYSAATGYDRYSYVDVTIGDAAKAGSLPTKSLVYMSGTSVQTSWSTGVSYQEALANNWLLKDANGQYLRNAQYGAYVGDIGNSAYQQRFIDNVAGVLSRNGNEGVHIDDVIMTPTMLTGGVFPAKYPTQTAWEDAIVSFIRTVGQGLRSRGYYVLAQAIGFIPGDAPGSNDGTTNARFWSRLAPNVDALLSEYWMQLAAEPTRLRSSGNHWTQYWEGWLNQVNVAQSAGADFFAYMYGSSSSVNIMRYGKASFLLEWDGTGGGFVYQTSGDPWNLEWTMDIGRPSGPRYQVGIGWRRDYSGGTVILNSSASANQTFDLGGTYTRPDGTAVTSVTLAPTTALILKGSAAPPSPPANTALPGISGTPEVGQTLSSSTGTWSGSPSAYAYQWKRCDSAGGNCASVTGATASRYTLVSADLGKRMRVTVAASNAGGSGSATSNATSAVVPPPSTSPPANTALPVITGTAQQGATLSASTGTWANSPTSYAHQWKRCDTAGANCAPISGATGSQYALVAGDVGKTMRVTVTATNAGGSAAATSNATAVVTAPPPPPPPPPPANQPPAATAPPVVTGTAQQGKTLASSTGGWSNSPTGFAYQWKRCDTAGANCASIAGANAAAYLLSAADVGKTMRVTVTASNVAGSASATSAATAVVAPEPSSQKPRIDVRPEISGIPQEGLVLTSTRGTWANSPRWYSYQWRRCNTSGGGCVDISGATDSRYTVRSSDVGRSLRVVVAASNDDGTSWARTDASAPVAPPPAAPGRPEIIDPPVITGVFRVGRTVQVSDGTWSGSPDRFTYQWRRCASWSPECKDIAGATATSYRVVEMDALQCLAVVVTAWNAAGPTSVHTRVEDYRCALGSRGGPGSDK